MRSSVTALTLFAGVLMMPVVATAQDRAERPVLAPNPLLSVETPGYEIKSPGPKPAEKSASLDDEFPAQTPAVKPVVRPEVVARPSVERRCENVFLPIVGGNPNGRYECD